MRLLIVLLFVCAIVVAGCRGGSSGVQEKTSEPKASKKDQPGDVEPVDLGDPTQPTEIRALKGAEDVKEKIDAQQKENQEVLDARD